MHITTVSVGQVKKNLHEQTVLTSNSHEWPNAQEDIFTEISASNVKGEYSGEEEKSVKIDGEEQESVKIDVEGQGTVTVGGDEAMKTGGEARHIDALEVHQHHRF